MAATAAYDADRMLTNAMAASADAGCVVLAPDGRIARDPENRPIVFAARDDAAVYLADYQHEIEQVHRLAPICDWVIVPLPATPDGVAAAIAGARRQRHEDRGAHAPGIYELLGLARSGLVDAIEHAAVICNATPGEQSAAGELTGAVLYDEPAIADLLHRAQSQVSARHTRAATIRLDVVHRVMEMALLDALRTRRASRDRRAIDRALREYSRAVSERPGA